MPSRPLPFLLGVALLDDAPAPDGARWRARVELAERAGLDVVTLEAGPADGVLIAAQVAARTSRIGLLPLAPATTTEPFHVSTSIATVDEVSGARAGWLTTVLPTAAAQGQVTWTVPTDVYADAAEHVDAVRALWDSWEDGAEIRDAATARFLDRERVHHVDLRGQHIAVRGPSITPRPPQGNPPVALRAVDAAGLELAERVADLVLTAESAGGPPDVPGLVRIVELAGGADLAGRVAHAEAAGYDGALVHAGDELDAVLDALAPTLAARPAAPATGTLRERLGLAPATNRFAAAA